MCNVGGIVVRGRVGVRVGRMIGVRPACGFSVGKGGSLVGLGERVWGRIPLEP